MSSTPGIARFHGADTTAAAVAWWWFGPPRGTQPPWLADLHGMRGVVLYDEGRRPAFRQSDGCCRDDDPLDLAAHHVLAVQDGQVIGAVRLLAGAEGMAEGAVQSLLGKASFDRLAAGFGAPAQRCGEVGRLMVASGHRSRGIGLSLVAGIWAVCRRLGLATVVAAAGTREGQDKMLERTGARPAEGLPLIHSRRFADELRILLVDVACPEPSFEGCIRGMDEVLGSAE